jgi:hypothetical protein
MINTWFTGINYIINWPLRMIAGLYFYDQLRPYMQETRLKIIMPMYGVWENISILGISLKLSLLTPYK